MRPITVALSKCFPLLVIGWCLLTSCNKPTINKNSISRIDIATSGCLRGCPVVGLSIDSTLELKYYGGYKARLHGYYEGEVSNGFWDTLNYNLKMIKFNELDTSKDMPIDGEVAEVIFYWNGQKRHVYKSIYEDADSVSHILIGVINSYQHIELHKIKDSIKFETIYQYLMPPSPKAYNVVFPPPVKNQLIKHNR